MDVLLIYGVLNPFISHFRLQWHLWLHCVLACCIFWCLLSLSMSPGPTHKDHPSTKLDMFLSFTMSLFHSLSFHIYTCFFIHQTHCYQTYYIKWFWTLTTSLQWNVCTWFVIAYRVSIIRQRENCNMHLFSKPFVICRVVGVLKSGYPVTHLPILHVFGSAGTWTRDLLARRLTHR